MRSINFLLTYLRFLVTFALDKVSLSVMISSFSFTVLYCAYMSVSVYVTGCYGKNFAPKGYGYGVGAGALHMF